MTKPAEPYDQRLLWDDLHHRHWSSAERSGPTPLGRRLVRLLPAHQKILELGCGSGTDALFFRDSGHAVTATDFSEYVIRANNRAFRSRQVDFRLQDLRDPLAFADSMFDAVYARLSLHYFSDPVTRGIMREIGRVLRPGGVLLFSCRSIRDPLCGTGEAVGQRMFVVERQIRHFFSRGYAADVVSGSGCLWVEKLSEHDEDVYGFHSYVVECLARLSPDRP